MGVGVGLGAGVGASVGVSVDIAVRVDGSVAEGNGLVGRVGRTVGLAVGVRALATGAVGTDMESVVAVGVRVGNGMGVAAGSSPWHANNSSVRAVTIHHQRARPNPAGPPAIDSPSRRFTSGFTGPGKRPTPGYAAAWGSGCTPRTAGGAWCSGCAGARTRPAGRGPPQSGADPG